jgi:hypothetical protein
MALVPLGMARFAWQARNGDSTNARCAQVVLCYFAGCALFYSLYGSWLENRYFLVLFPVVFLSQAAGLEWVGQAVGRVVRRPIVATGVVAVGACWIACLHVPVLLTYGEPGHRYVGDWTAPFAETRSIAHTLIRQYGVTPKVWNEQVYVFWRWPFVGPECFERWYRAEPSKGGDAPGSGSGYLVLCDGCPVPDYIAQNPNIILGDRVKEPYFTLIRYHTRDGRTYANTNNPNIHSGPELEVERFAQQPRAYQINLLEDGARVFYRLPAGRIVVQQEVRLQRARDGKWNIVSRLESPSLSGYYQEIKTVYQPFVEARAPNGEVVFRGVITDELLGGNLVKTPVGRTFSSMTLPDAVSFRIGAQTWYDRAAMGSPHYEPFSLPVFKFADGHVSPLEAAE